jgi:hypothetical protein
MSLPRTAVVLSILACFLSTTTLAQTPTATVNGIVTDPSGATVPDARVTVVNQDTNIASAMNSNSAGAPYEYFFNTRLSKGPCAFDTPKVLAWTSIYEMPFGHGKRWLTHGPLSWVLGNWATNYAFVARSGTAFNPTWGGASNACTAATATNCVPTSITGVAPTSTDPANLSNAGGSITGYSRPSLLSGCNLTGTQTVSQWYNPACFVSPSSLMVSPGYGFGNAPIGNMRSMRFINVDVALTKEIAIRENKRLQFRAEAFNVFNHMVLGVPGTSIAPSFSNGSVSYGSAGIISSIANAPRELQLAMKFMF